LAEVTSAGVTRKLINGQVRLSHAFDQVLAEEYRKDGNLDFVTSFVPKYLRPHFKVYDVGGGKHPYVSTKLKSELELSVVGLDIDQNELNQAPQGAYDELVCSDIAGYRGKQDADLIICQAVLEHVEDVEQAFAAMASILRPGGKALVFVPSRNAVFARLNLILPERIKRKLLYSIYPQTRSHHGFRSYYDRCTPKDFNALARRFGLEIEERRLYFISAYFSFFFPAYLIWRLWIFLYHFLAGERAAETFSMALRRTPSRD
jgi:2-polyprenyl-6-hydroxyphenyl methylase/3-demethylubiquinone-9 3-methyltransferase